MDEELKFKIRSLNKTFGNNHVLKGIDLDVVKGSSLIILGGSGSGKSVLIKLMVGLLTADSGSILYEGNESIGMPYKDRLKMLENCGWGGKFEPALVTPKFGKSSGAAVLWDTKPPCERRRA